MEKSQLIAVFSDVISCEVCDTYTSKKLLRDSVENIPQPGYVGENHDATRLLLVGQNPGVAPDRMLERDKVYTKSLRSLAKSPDIKNYNEFYRVVIDFVPEWPVNRNYFPLEECGLTLDDIAYCNIVRCRTEGNATPSDRLAQNCINAHFRKTIQALEPRAVVFIGKWAHDQAAHTLPSHINYSFMNRMRSLSSSERLKNRGEVVQMVNQSINA